MLDLPHIGRPFPWIVVKQTVRILLFHPPQPDENKFIHSLNYYFFLSSFLESLLPLAEVAHICSVLG